MMLYIVRHAWAVDRDDPELDDASRQLTDEGRERFDLVAKLLVKRGFAPAVIATSPLVRCRETADILVDRLTSSVQIVALEELSPGAELAQLVSWTAEHAAGVDAAWVGHAPDVEQLTAELIGGSRAAIRFAKGAAAAIRFPDGIAAGRGELRWLVSAKILGC